MSNAYSETIELTLWSKIVGFFVALLITILNSIEIHLLKKTRKKPFYENILLSLTICDLIGGALGLIVVPFVILVELKFYHTLNWIVWGFCMSSSVLSSLIHLIVISMDRLWAVATPLKYRQHASKGKIAAAVSLAWGVPMLFLAIHITLVLYKKLGVDEIYAYMRDTMFIIVARIVVIADIVLIISYFSIMWILAQNNSSQARMSRQYNLLNTLLLCVGIVLAFLVFTTPFVAMYVVVWNRPKWFLKLSLFLFPLNQISNSIIYLTQKFKKKRQIVAHVSNINVSAD